MTAEDWEETLSHLVDLDDEPTPGALTLERVLIAGIVLCVIAVALILFWGAPWRPAASYVRSETLDGRNHMHKLRKLILNRETIATLSSDELAGIRGARAIITDTDDTSGSAGGSGTAQTRGTFNCTTSCLCGTSGCPVTGGCPSTGHD